MMTTPTMNVTRDFALAGKAIFTISAPSGARYTFRINRKNVNYQTNLPKLGDDVFFMYVKTDNVDGYAYVGAVAPEEGGLIHTKASRFPRPAQPYQVALFALRIIWGRQALPEGYTLLHAGRCGRCGKVLTTTESIQTGIGPECQKRMNDKTFPAPARQAYYGSTPRRRFYATR